MIKLESVTGDPILLNPDQVLYMIQSIICNDDYSCTDCTSIRFSEGFDIKVKESLETIQERIRKFVR